jgi:hypothetical protein
MHHVAHLRDSLANLALRVSSKLSLAFSEAEAVAVVSPRYATTRTLN